MNKSAAVVNAEKASQKKAMLLEEMDEITQMRKEVENMMKKGFEMPDAAELS